MMICFELGKTEQEVGSWSFEDLTRWAAFFRLKNKAETAAIEKARKTAGNR